MLNAINNPFIKVAYNSPAAANTQQAKVAFGMAHTNDMVATMVRLRTMTGDTFESTAQ